MAIAWRSARFLGRRLPDSVKFYGPRPEAPFAELTGIPPMNGQFGRHKGRIGTEPGVRQRRYRREDGWSLADWSTIAVGARIWPHKPASGRASPAGSQIGRTCRRSSTSRRRQRPERRDGGQDFLEQSTRHYDLGIWNVIDRPCRTIFAPIFTRRSRSVLIDHCAASGGSASVRRKLARL